MWTTEDITDQTGKTIIITGANTGIGFETAKVLYEKGAHVILACRDLHKAQLAIDKLKQKITAGKIELAHLDLSSQVSIKIFTDEIKQKYAALHVLVNNAGIMTPPHAKTPEGYEWQFAVNYLGHFTLTGHLYPLLQKTKGARIVTVTSLGYLYGSIDFDNLQSEKSYDPFREYCQSKLANLLFTMELQRRITQKNDQVLSLASHPGLTQSDISRHMTEVELISALERLGPAMETWQGALPSLYASTSPEVDGGGLYGPGADGGLRGNPAISPIQENALDEAVAQKLWTMTESVTGVVFP